MFEILIIFKQMCVQQIDDTRQCMVVSPSFDKVRFTSPTCAVGTRTAPHPAQDFNKKAEQREKRRISKILADFIILKLFSVMHPPREERKRKRKIALSRWARVSLRGGDLLTRHD